MRQVLSRHISDFAALHDDDVELVSVGRPSPTALAGLARQLATERRDLQVRWTQNADDGDNGVELAASAMAATRLPAAQLQALSDEVTYATDVLTSLLGCPAVGVRVATLRRPMCPRFHVDQVPCRLLIAVDGPGTEWIPSDQVDQGALTRPGADVVPIRAGHEVRQFKTGSWSLLKGGAWARHFGGVVHRSPHTDTARLLVSLDPLFSLEREGAATAAGNSQSIMEQYL